MRPRGASTRTAVAATDDGASTQELTVEDGELLFQANCATCHGLDLQGSEAGPSLYGVVGRKAGMEPGYAYSQSLKDSAVTWDPNTLDKWIADPDAVIPGNAMSPPYSGITDAATRKKIVAFLESISPGSQKHR